MQPQHPHDAGARWDEVRRDVVCDHLAARKRLGEQERHELCLAWSSSVGIEVTVEERRVVRRVAQLLRRIGERNREALLAMGWNTPSPNLKRLAWKALEPLRCVFFTEGDYRVRFAGRHVVRYEVSAQEAELLRQYDELLHRLYCSNRDAVERLIQSRGLASTRESRPPRVTAAA